MCDEKHICTDWKGFWRTLGILAGCSALAIGGVYFIEWMGWFS